MKNFTDSTTNEALEMVKMNEAKEDAISTISTSIQKLVKDGHSVEEIKQMFEGLMEQYKA